MTRRRYAIHYPNVDVVRGVMQEGSPARRRIPAVLFCLAVVALVVGLFRPEATVLLPREEATIVLALDTSASMKGEDVAPNRLEVAKDAAISFVGQLPPKFQVGVVTFSERAEVLAQPTRDRLAVRDGIRSLRPFGATAIGDAIARATELAPETWVDENGRKLKRDRGDRPLTAILLLSDGANTAGKMDPSEAAERASKIGIPVYTIAMGPEEGATEGPDSVLIDPPDHQTLRAIAESTDGRYFSAPTEQELNEIYDSLASRLGLVKERQEITFAFAGAGALLALIATILGFAWSSRLP